MMLNTKNDTLFHSVSFLVFNIIKKYLFENSKSATFSSFLNLDILKITCFST